jgi:death-on-curing protein
MAIHEAQLAEHGGGVGVRDQGLLESALARQQQVHAYSENPTLARLATAYAFGLAKNHAFVDGKKRTAWIVCATFLEINGRTVTATQQDVVTVMLGVADSSMKEEQFTQWLEQNSR